MPSLAMAQGWKKRREGGSPASAPGARLIGRTADQHGEAASRARAMDGPSESLSKAFQAIASALSMRPSFWQHPNPN